MREEVGKVGAKENSSPSMVTEPETDYSISDMLAQIDVEANNVELNPQDIREKPRKRRNHCISTSVFILQASSTTQSSPGKTL